MPGSRSPEASRGSTPKKCRRETSSSSAEKKARARSSAARSGSMARNARIRTPFRTRGSRPAAGIRSHSSGGNARSGRGSRAAGPSPSSTWPTTTGTNDRDYGVTRGSIQELAAAFTDQAGDVYYVSPFEVYRPTVSQDFSFLYGGGDCSHWPPQHLVRAPRSGGFLPM